MTKVFALLLSLCLTAQAWIAPQQGSLISTRLYNTEQENPCWQDIFDEDCSLDNAYAASFVASKWLKSMPCADGIAVRTILRTTRHCGKAKCWHDRVMRWIP
jgi:hypothetical protein